MTSPNGPYRFYAHQKPNVGPDSGQHLIAGIPGSPISAAGEPQADRGLNVGPSAAPLPAAEHHPNDYAARVIPDIVHLILDNLPIGDLLSVEKANIAPEWTWFAKSERIKLLEKLQYSEVFLSTGYHVDRTREESSECLDPVYSRTSPPEGWVLPTNRLVVFEPNPYDVQRDGYYPHTYEPDELVMHGLPGHPRPYKWPLIPHHQRSPRDGDHRGRFFLSPTNCKTEREDRFSIFSYYNELDVKMDYETKIWYKLHGNKMQLHCISIRLELLDIMLKEDF
jgi:hypothetical protein